MEKFKVLITGAGAPGAAGIIRSLREEPNIFICAVDINSDAYGKYLADSFHQIPDADDVDFIDSIIEICKSESIKVVLPLVTRELNHFSNSLKRFEELGIKVLVSEPESLEVANNKGKLYETLKKAGLVVPDFFIVKNWNEMENAFEKLGYPNSKVIIKPCLSNGLRGFRIIQKEIDELDFLLNYKPDNRFISKEKLKTIFENAQMPDYIVSEYLPGDEYTVDILAQNGKVLQIVPRSRLETKGGISTKGEIVNNLEIIEYSIKIVELLKLNWLIGIQVKEAYDGTFKILEINPRIQGTTVACLGAGINFAKSVVNLALNNTFEYKEPKWGTKFSRFWNEVYY